MTDLETWILDNRDEYKFNVYLKKHIYTPYEQEQLYSDETREELVLEETYIDEGIELPNGDVMIGFYLLIDDEKSKIFYYKLSEIRLEKIEEE